MNPRSETHIVDAARVFGSPLWAAMKALLLDREKELLNEMVTADSYEDIARLQGRTRELRRIVSFVESAPDALAKIKRRTNGGL